MVNKKTSCHDKKHKIFKFQKRKKKFFTGFDMKKEKKELNMNIQPISSTQPNFNGKMKFKEINVYDIDTGKLLRKMESHDVETKDVLSITTAFLSRIKEDSAGINTLIQVMQDDKTSVYYGVPQTIANVTKAYFKVKDLNKTTKL